MAITGVGVVFNRNSVAVAGVNSISGPDKTRDTIDTTALDTAGGYRTFIGGFRDGGEITLTMNYEVVGYTNLDTDFAATANQSYEIVLSDTGNTSYAFSGWVTSLGMDIPLDDKVTMTVTIKVDGVITQTS